MRKLLTICCIFAVFLLSSTDAWSLPRCPGSYNNYTWSNCVGYLTSADGSEYVGEFRDGKPNGRGTFTSTDGGKYVGEFKDVEWHGQGTYTSANGDKYVGEFKDSKQHGQGSITYAGGNKYVGHWKDGKPHGRGTYTYAGGSKYVGEYKDGSKHGQGTYTFATGDKYVGEWRDSEWHGQGTVTFADGSKHAGEFKDGKRHGQGISNYVDGRVLEGIWENGEFLYAQKVSPPRRPEPSVVAKAIPEKSKPEPSPPPQSGSASGFFISKMGHVVTNAHVVEGCKRVTVGDNANKQTPAEVISTDKRNDLALLKLSSLNMASAETKSLIRKLEVKLVPLAADGLLRSQDVELGEKVMVAGYPYGDVFSNTIKVTSGIVSAVRGMGDDTGQFQMDAAVQSGNSGGPVYDENGNIVGVVVSQLNKLKVAKAIGSLPENVNFGIKASTVRQFLTSSGLPSKWSERSKDMSTKQLAKIAEKQTLMVMCHQ